MKKQNNDNKKYEYIIDFIEKLLDIKLLPCQKEFIYNVIQRNPINYPIDKK